MNKKIILFTSIVLASIGLLSSNVSFCMEEYSTGADSHGDVQYAYAARRPSSPRFKSLLELQTILRMYPPSNKKANNLLLEVHNYMKPYYENPKKEHIARKKLLSLQQQVDKIKNPQPKKPSKSTLKSMGKPIYKSKYKKPRRIKRKKIFEDKSQKIKRKIKELGTNFIMINLHNEISNKIQTLINEARHIKESSRREELLKQKLRTMEEKYQLILEFLK